MHAFSTLALTALFTAMVNAAPVVKRDIVWVTETDVDIVTVPITKTVWVDGPGATKEAVIKHHRRPATTRTSVVKSTVSANSASAAPKTTTSSVYVASTTVSSTSVSVAPTTSSTSVSVAPTTSSTSVSVAPTTSTYVVPTTSTSAYVAPTTTEAPTSVYVPPTTSSSAPAATSSASSSGSGVTGTAASGTSYEGDFTWYAVGLGACGVTSSSSDHVIAISQEIFDLYTPNGNPNLNPLCGKTVSAMGKDGSTYQATVVDRCVGCAPGDLDFSEEYFKIVTSNGDGRVPNMKWTWN